MYQQSLSYEVTIHSKLIPLSNLYCDNEDFSRSIVRQELHKGFNLLHKVGEDHTGVMFCYWSLTPAGNDDGMEQKEVFLVEKYFNHISMALFVKYMNNITKTFTVPLRPQTSEGYF